MSDRRFGASRWAVLFASVLGVALIPPTAASAHHSYAMFDGTKTLSVTGTVAKLEWMNPHVYVWVYAPNAASPSGYDLYAFENGSISVLSRLGWTKATFAAGEKITVEYWPLKDGRTGGHFVKATSEDGRVALGVGGPGATGLPREPLEP